jgi:hypothetical protein
MSVRPSKLIGGGIISFIGCLILGYLALLYAQSSIVSTTSQGTPSFVQSTGLFLSGVADPGVPAITIVQSKSLTANVPSPIAFNSNVTAGSLLIMVLTGQNSGIFSDPIVITDTQANVWTQQRRETTGGNSIVVLTAIANSTGADSLSLATLTSFGGSTAMIAEISGDITQTVDTVASFGGGAHQAPAVTTGFANDLILVGGQCQATFTGLVAPDVFIQNNATYNSYYAMASWRLQSAVGSVTPSMSCAGNTSFVTLALKTVAVASPGVNGDWYLNKTTHHLFGPKTAGTWPDSTFLISKSPGTVEEHVASSSASLAFTSCITSAYDDYKVRYQLVPASGSTQLELQVSTDGGATYDTGANYNYLVNGYNSTSQSTTATYIKLGDSLVASVEAPATGELDIFAPNSSTANKQFRNFMFAYVNDTSTQFWFLGGGTYKSHTAVNAFRLLFSSGNISSGYARCYGVAK